LEQRVRNIKARAGKEQDTTTFAARIHKVMSGDVPSESGKVNITRVAWLPALVHKPWSKRRQRRPELMPLALYYLADGLEQDLATASVIVGGSSHGEFFERRVAGHALTQGAKGGFPARTLTVPAGDGRGGNGRTQCKLVAGPREDDAAYSARREMDWSLKRDGRIEHGFERLRALESDEGKVVLWMPTATFPAIDFAFWKRHVMNAKVGRNPTMTCASLLRFHEKLHGAGSDTQVTLDLLRPAAGADPGQRATQSSAAAAAATEGLTLKGDAGEHAEVLRKYRLRLVRVPREAMGHGFEELIRESLERYGLLQ
jgi:hypothetical protein